MIARTLEPSLRRAARQSPVVAVTGPRQSGKTTLCRACFPDHDYVSLEPLDGREFAETDPRGFLAQHSGPVVFDEVQRAPGLFSGGRMAGRVRRHVSSSGMFAKCSK